MLKDVGRDEEDDTGFKGRRFEEESGFMVVSTAGRNAKHADHDSEKIASMDHSSTKERMNNRIKELYPADTNVYAETPFDEETVDPHKEELKDESRVSLVEEETFIKNDDFSKINKDLSLKAPRELMSPSSKILLKKKYNKKLNKPSEEIYPEIISNLDSSLVRPLEKNNFTSSKLETQAKVKTIMEK